MIRLDEIEPQIVGAAHIKKIIACAEPWAKKNLTILDSELGVKEMEICTEQDVLEKQQKTGLPRRDECPKSMKVVLDHLVKIEMMEVVHIDELNDFKNEKSDCEGSYVHGGETRKLS